MTSLYCFPPLCKAVAEQKNKYPYINLMNEVTAFQSHLMCWTLFLVVT